MCGEPVIAKMGSVVRHHWSHKGKRIDCDPWSDGHSAWHLDWQALWHPSHREVVLDELRNQDRVRHRADVLTRDGVVIEFQHSSLSADKMWERIDFYQRMCSSGRMVWVFDIAAHLVPFTDYTKPSKVFVKSSQIGLRGEPIWFTKMVGGGEPFPNQRFKLFNEHSRYRFTWKNAWRSIGEIVPLSHEQGERLGIYLDLGDGRLFELHEWSSAGGVHGYGEVLTKSMFLQMHGVGTTSAISA